MSTARTWWSALYQQRPTPREGLFFNVAAVEIVEAAPVELKCVRAWDKAATRGAGDYTVGVKMGISPDKILYVLDVVRGRWATDERNRMIRRTAEFDGHEVGIRGPQDPGSAGVDSASDFVKLLSGYGVRVKHVTGSKESRAESFSAQLNAGNVKLVRGRWNRDFLEELQAFPRGAHDDQVDAASDAYNELCQRREYLVA